MKTRKYLGVLIGLTAVLFVAATPLMGDGSDSDSSQTENATEHHAAGTWKTVVMGNGEECEGLVFESAEGAKEAALKMGCSGYHEHQQEDGTFVYMPCDLKGSGAALNVEAIEAKIQDALVQGEITQEQANEKLAWLESKSLEY